MPQCAYDGKYGMEMVRKWNGKGTERLRTGTKRKRTVTERERYGNERIAVNNKVKFIYRFLKFFQTQEKMNSNLASLMAPPS